MLLLPTDETLGQAEKDSRFFFERLVHRRVGRPGGDLGGGDLGDDLSGEPGEDPGSGSSMEGGDLLFRLAGSIKVVASTRF